MNDRPCTLRSGWSRRFGIVAGVLLAAGCSTPYRSIVADVDSDAWSEPVELILANSDTVNAFDWQLFFRCPGPVEPDTLSLSITLLSPDSLRCVERFAFRLPAVDAPAARLRECAVDYRRRVRLSRTGDYRIRIAPLRPLSGIEAVGLQTQPSTSD